MADIDTGSRPAKGWTAQRLWPAEIALVLALAASALSLLPALAAGLRGTRTAISFPHGSATALLVTAAACAGGAWFARRAGLAAIPLGLALWPVMGTAAVVVGLSLGVPTSPTGESCCWSRSPQTWPPGFRSLPSGRDATQRCRARAGPRAASRSPAAIPAPGRRARLFNARGRLAALSCARPKLRNAGTRRVGVPTRRPARVLAIASSGVMVPRVGRTSPEPGET
jgi:hypothetical protein